MSELRSAARPSLEEAANIRLLFDSTSEGFYAVDTAGTTTMCNAAFVAMLGFADESAAIGRKLHDVIHHTHPDGRQYSKDECPIYRCASTGVAAHVVGENFFRLDATPLPVEYWARPIVRDGVLQGAICTFVDATARRHAELAARESEARFRTIADHAPVMMWVTEPDGQCSYLNRRWYEFTGQTEDQALGMGWLDVVHPAHRSAAADAFHAANVAQAPFRIEYRLRRADGIYRWAIDAAMPRFGAHGEFLGHVGSVIDIDERREAEDRVRGSEERFRAAVDAVQGVLWTNNAIGEMVGEQPGWAALTGQTQEQYEGYGWAAAVHPDDAQPTVDAWNAAVAARGAFVFEHRVRCHDGQWRRFSVRAIPTLDSSGAVSEWVGVHTDVTDQRATEQDLREINDTLEQRVAEEVAHRTRAEEALRQAQKMEAVGQLTGGLAHDFNNLLTVVIGNLDMARRGLGEGDAARAERAIGNSLKGAERAATLTQRLLAFSRRQPLQPKPTDVGRLLNGMSELIARTLGETIQLETVVNAGVWRVEVDAHQLESALLNLAVNARDAMDGAGRLTIEASNSRIDESYAAVHAVTTGQYVAVCVTDTGAGMDREVIERAFDPFFTTKDVGKGTGLGLSQVYGFVKQSGGHVKIYSEVGHGTTVKLYLPRLMGHAEIEDDLPVVAAGRGSESETVLVVEDDDDVRAFTVESLRELGYRVLEAYDGPSALRLLARQDISIGLLLTDVVMPEMSGRELADAARARQPSLKVLFTTGYARNAIVHGGRLDPGVEVLLKPFTFEALAGKVREVIDKAASDRLLVVDADDDFRLIAAQLLEKIGFAVDTAITPREALGKLRAANGNYGAVILDDGLSIGRIGTLMAELRAVRDDLPILLTSRHDSAAHRRDHADDHCIQVLAKPYGGAQLHDCLSALRVQCGSD